MEGSRLQKHSIHGLQRGGRAEGQIERSGHCRKRKSEEDG